MIWPGLRSFSADNIEWVIEEESVLERLRTDLSPETLEAIRGGSDEDEAQLAHNLFSACYRRLPKRADPPPALPDRPGVGLRWLTGVDLDLVIHPLLIRLSAAYLDQGQSYWPMPRSEEGFYPTVRDLLGQDGLYRLSPEEQHLVGLGRSSENSARLA